MKKKLNEATRTITFTFAGLDDLEFHFDSMHHANKEYAALHGMLQRLGDCAASCKTEEERRAAVLALRDHYESGSPEWNTRAPATPKENATIRAIADKMGISYTEAEAEIQRRMLAEMSGE